MKNSKHNRSSRSQLARSIRPAIESIEQRLLLSAGAIDPTFGNDGMVLDQESSVGFGVATGFDSTTGDIIEAGTSNLDSSSPLPILLQRYSPTGKLDLSFGVDGTTQDNAISGIPTQITVQTDGKILVLADNGEPATLERFTTSGVADQTFGFAGFFQTNSATNLIGSTFLLLPNGNIIISATVTTNSTSFSALDELNPDGSVDTSFGTNGVATGIPGFLTALAIDSNKNIVAVGSTPTNSLGLSSGLIERFTSTGQLDSSFGTNGSTIVPAVQDFNAVAIEPSGKIQAVGGISLLDFTSSGGLLLYQFTSSGAIDTSFGPGGAGFATLPLPYSPEQIDPVFQPDGKLLIGAGVQTTPGSFSASLARVNSDGSLDTTFGSGGYAEFGPGYSQQQFMGGLSLQSNGKIILGFSGVSSQVFPQGLDFDPTCLNANGTPDTTFGVDGTAPGRPLFATGDAVAELPNNQTLVAGEVIVGGIDAVYLRRYNIDGSLDSTFAPNLGYGRTSGYVFIPTPPQPFFEPPIVKRITLDSFGRILLAIANYGIVRLTAAGSLDTTFGTNGIAAIANFTDFALGPGGQIVVTSGPLTLESAANIVTRLSANGVVDKTFGSNGSVTVPTSTGPVTVLSNGKILVGGSMEVDGVGFEGTSNIDLAVTRLNTNGSIDTTFGNSGTATADYDKFDPGDYLNNEAQTLSLTILSNGNILAGATSQLQDAGGYSSVAAAEFLPNGKLNTSFGDDGEIGPFSPTSNFVSLAGVVVQSNGSFILAGGNYNGSQNDFFLARFTTAGIPDSSFGINGIVTVQFTQTLFNMAPPADTINSIAATTDGKVVIVGDAPDQFTSSSFGFAVARYDLGLGSVSGTVFNDFSGDGVRQPGEPGLSGQTVYDDLDNAGVWQFGDPETVTDSNGNYDLTGLPQGPTVIRQILQNGQRQSFPLGVGEHVIVGPSAITNINFGATSKVYISGTVFNDTNHNGTQDPTEPGLSGWTIYADLNNDGKFEPNEPGKTVGANGNFSFVALNAGSYVFRIIPPAGWSQTFPTNNFGQHVTLSSGGTITNINFGFFQTTTAASISGSVFNDANANGIQNPGELGLSGWTVYIDLTNSGTLQSNDPTTTTDSSGDFTFTNLAAGTYILRVISPTGWSQTLPTKSFGQHITLTTGQKVNAVLFGEKKT